MDIILDTNIIVHSGFLLRTRPFELLFDFIEKTQSQLIMTQLVWEELLSLYRNEIKQRQASAVKARRKLANMLLEEIGESREINIDVELMVERYSNFLKQRMRFSEKDIVRYHDHYLRELVPRAINRRRPFTEKGEEFRDAVLWLTVLDIGESKETKTVVFISGNIRQYGSDASGINSPGIQAATRLDPDLFQESSAREINVLYYPSVDSFLKSQSVEVEYVTKNWLMSQLSQSEIADDLINIINDYDEDDIKGQLGKSNREIIGWGGNDAHLADIKDFFVYETMDGSYFVIAIALFIIQGTCDYEREIEEPDYDTDIGDDGRRIAYVVGSYTTLETDSEDFEAEIRVALSIILRDKSISKLYVENWEVVDLWS